MKWLALAGAGGVAGVAILTGAGVDEAPGWPSATPLLAHPYVHAAASVDEALDDVVARYCAGCHSGWNFTDNEFHDIGLFTTDIGRAGIERGSPRNRHAFKTPGLRDLTYRAPFMHNGSIADLEGVIMHYESGGIERPSRSAEMQAFELTDEERGDLLAFLRALTAEVSNTPVPNLPN